MNNKENNSLINVNKKGIIYRIKLFFINAFGRKKDKNTEIEPELKKEDITNDATNKKEDFLKYIKNIEDEGTRLIKLQKEYEEGNIKEENMSIKQIQDLKDLYRKQIDFLEKSNEYKKKKLLEYNN